MTVEAASAETIRARQRYGATAASVVLPSASLELASIQELDASCPSASRWTGWTLFRPCPPSPCLDPALGTASSSNTSPTQIASAAYLYRPLFRHPSSLLLSQPSPSPKLEPIRWSAEAARTEVSTTTTTTTRWVAKETNGAPCLVPDIGQPLAGRQYSDLPLPGRAIPVRPSTSNLTLLTHMSVQGRTPPAHAVTPEVRTFCPEGHRFPRPLNRQTPCEHRLHCRRASLSHWNAVHLGTKYAPTPK